MAAIYPPTHDAIVTTSERAPLQVHQVPTIAPQANEVLVRVQWVASSPVDLHFADSSSLVPKRPFILGCGFAGTVVATGPEDETATKPRAEPLVVGDEIFGFTPPDEKMQGFQEYVTVPRHLMGRIPESIPMQAAVTVPTNLVTAFFVGIHDLGIDLPWPIPEGWKPSAAEAPILIWGGASSVGMFTIQVFRHWGYGNIVAVASAKHHAELKELGAGQCFDYSDEAVTDKINASTPYFPYIVDCIGRLEGTLRPLTKIAKKGTKLAIMIPIIIQDATSDSAPVLTVSSSGVLVDEWAEGVQLRDTHTFLYEKVDLLKWHCQPDIMPELLASGVVKPNRQRIVEGVTLLERAQKALELLRERAPSGERLVWRVSED